MSSSPALPPAQQDATALHQRLLSGDPTASNDLANACLEPLVVWLRETNPRVSEDVCLEAAEEAILTVIRNPTSYSPERQTLEVYLRMSARGDLLNLLGKERRRNKGRVSLASVELLPDVGKYLGRVDDPSLRLCLDEEKQGCESAIPDSLRRELCETDLHAMELIVQKERETGVFAALFGLLHLPVKEQRREVKRRKDRLKKMLERARRKA
jgi:hypothetical protein